VSNGYPPGTPMGRNGFPKGSIGDSPYAQPIPADELGKRLQREVGAENVNPPLNDPAFQPPTDPLAGKTKSKPTVVQRDIPIISTITTWDVSSVRNALTGMMEGIFDKSGQFCDSVLGDDRVQATMGSRLAGLWGREVRIKPANDSAAAKEVADAWQEHWPLLAESAGLNETHVYGILQGSAYGQVVWDTSGSIWKPYPRPWHPRYSFYHWPARKFVAIGQDGLVAIIPGDGSWYGYEPYGSYRAWVRGGLRALAEPWLGLRFARRDWWRFNEVHGLPIRKAYTPASADPTERAVFQANVASLGSESSMLIPRGVDKDLGYDLDLLEAKDTNWESFERTINECHLAIVLILKWQNLTTEITAGGSYAAAREHGKGEVSQVAHDNATWRKTIRRDFARPFALYNFGDAELAPITDHDVPEPPREDYAGNADVFSKVGQAVAALTQAGFKFNDETQFGDWLSRRFGLHDIPKVTISAAPAVKTADAATSTAEAAHKTADASITKAETDKKKADEPPPPAPEPGKP